MVVSKGRLHDTRLLKGFVASSGKSIKGVVTYIVENSDCEIVLLNSFVKSKGIGKSLGDRSSQSGLHCSIRDVLVRDCPAHGILGADQGSGSCLMEFVEVRNCGEGDRRHQIYMATDEVHHPGSVFRMQFCFVHDAKGGNNVKWFFIRP